jgi:hypothetical protein
MRTYVVHHPSDLDFVTTLLREMERREFTRVATPAEADVALLLVSRAALERGLGRAPREALAAGIAVLTLLLGDDAVPPAFPVHRKHTPLVKDVAGVLKQLVEHRKQRDAHQIEGKRELFAQGVLLALLHRS